MAFVDDLLGGGGGAPTFNAPEMDKKHQDQLTNQLGRGNSDVEAAYGRSQKQLSGGMMPTNTNRFNSSLGGADTSAQTSAIQQKGQSIFSHNVQKMALQNKLQEEQAKSAQMTQNFNLSSRQMQIFNDIKQEKIQSEMAEIATRNQILGSIFGGAGSAVGAYFGNKQTDEEKAKKGK